MALRTLMKGLMPALPPGMPAFIGGAVGAIGYEAVGEFENLPAPKPVLRGPTSTFMIADDLIIFDNFRHTLMLSAAARTDEFETLRAAYDEGVRRVRVMKVIHAKRVMHGKASEITTDGRGIFEGLP